MMTVLVGVCLMVGTAYGKPYEFSTDKAAKKALPAVLQRRSDLIGQAIKAQKTGKTAESETDFYDDLGTEVAATQPVAENSVWNGQVTSYYRGRRNYKALPALIIFSATIQTAINSAANSENE